ncbi:MAG: serine/threonine-protein kinase [Candidatus Eisenbacteria bacterium]
MTERPIWDPFCEALLLPRGERSAFLDRECAGRPEVRREIDRMLDACGGDPFIRIFLGDELEVSEELPRTLGSYSLVEKVGRGGMGVVYRAKETSIDLDIAVKRIAPQFANHPRFVELLRREARTLAALRHPNVAAVHRLEEVEGELLLVMEWIEGQTLASRIEDRGRLDWRFTIRIAKSIASALSYAHSHGIVHCDLKPGNVMISEHGEVKVLDFGIARAMRGSRDSEPDDVAKAAATETRLRGLSYSAGTPGYISPERQQGEIDPRADIWALGVCMQECLTGCAAYPATIAEGDDGRGIGPRRPLRVPRGTPRAFKRLIDACLDPDPRRRPQSMDEVKRRLDRIERGRGAWLWRAAVMLIIALLLAWWAHAALLRWEWRNLREVEIERGAVVVTTPLRTVHLVNPSVTFPAYKKATLLRPEGSVDPVVVGGGAADARTGVATLVVWDRWRVSQTVKGPNGPTFESDEAPNPVFFVPNEWNELRPLPGPDASLYLVAACCANYFPSRCYVFDFEGAVGARRLHERYRLDHAGHVASCAWTGPLKRGEGVIWLAGSVNSVVRSIIGGYQGISYFVACMPDTVRGEGTLPPDAAHAGDIPWLYSGVRGYETANVNGEVRVVPGNSTPFEFANRSAAVEGRSNDTVLLSTTLSCTLTRDGNLWRTHWSVGGPVEGAISRQATREGRDSSVLLQEFVADSMVTLLHVSPRITAETNVRRIDAGW